MGTAYCLEKLECIFHMPDAFPKKNTMKVLKETMNLWQITHHSRTSLECWWYWCVESESWFSFGVSKNKPSTVLKSVQSVFCSSFR